MLPTDDEARKALPVFRGPILYFPDAICAIAAVCKAGNDQHNPGEPLHWAREKSTEQLDTALRHMMDHGMGRLKDIDGQWHLAKAAWRLLAELQLAIEAEQAADDEALLHNDCETCNGWDSADSDATWEMCDYPKEPTLLEQLEQAAAAPAATLTSEPLTISEIGPGQFARVRERSVPKCSKDNCWCKNLDEPGDPVKCGAL